MTTKRSVGARPLLSSDRRLLGALKAIGAPAPAPQTLATPSPSKSQNRRLAAAQEEAAATEDLGCFATGKNTGSSLIRMLPQVTFTCPLCGSHCFGSSENHDGTWTRHCHVCTDWRPANAAEERAMATPCRFSWHQRDDHLYMKPSCTPAAVAAFVSSVRPVVTRSR